MSRTLLFLCCASMLPAMADVVTMQFTGPNGVTAFGYYVGPYAGTENGVPLALYCNDFANDITYGQIWQANVTPLDSDDFSLTRYDNPTLYREAAWLTTQYAGNPDDYAGIQAAIWSLFVPLPFPLPATTPGWIQAAEDNYTSLDYADFSIITNLNVQATGQVQEYIAPYPTPEPRSAVLLGTLLILAAGLCTRIRRRA
jgi:hypothetical protein